MEQGSTLVHFNSHGVLNVSLLNHRALIWLTFLYHRSQEQGHIPSKLAGTHTIRARRDPSCLRAQGPIPSELIGAGTRPIRAHRSRNTSRQSSQEQEHVPSELTGAGTCPVSHEASHKVRFVLMKLELGEKES